MSANGLWCTLLLAQDVAEDDAFTNISITSICSRWLLKKKKSHVYSSGGLTALFSACAKKSTTLRIFVVFQDIVLLKGWVFISYQDRKQQLMVRMSPINLICKFLDRGGNPHTAQTRGHHRRETTMLTAAPQNMLLSDGCTQYLTVSSHADYCLSVLFRKDVDKCNQESVLCLSPVTFWSKGNKISFSVPNASSREV